MRNQYNMNQTTLSIATEFIPEPEHVACYINDLVESMDYHVLYQTGRPREYDVRALMKLVLFAYLRGQNSCQLIERIARENLYARWLTHEQIPSYRTIARFIVSDEAERLIESSFESMHSFLVEHGLIDDCVFIDGTKILANANKYSFVWKKNIIRFDELNQVKAQALIDEIKATEAAAWADALPMDYDQLDLTVAQLEERVAQLMKKLKRPKRSLPTLLNKRVARPGRTFTRLNTCETKMPLKTYSTGVIVSLRLITMLLLCVSKKIQ